MNKMPYGLFAALSMPLALPGAAVGEHAAIVAAAEPPAATHAVMSHRQVAGYGTQSRAHH